MPDRAFYERRIAEERERARTTKGTAAKAHRDLAKLYEEKLATTPFEGSPREA